MFGANKVLIADKINDIKDGNKSIEKLVELKTRKTFKLGKSKSKKSFKSQKLAKSRKKVVKK